MMFMTLMYVFDNRYASRITLNIQYSTHPKLTKFLTRNLKYMRQCTLPSIFLKNFLFM